MPWGTPLQSFKSPGPWRHPQSSTKHSQLGWTLRQSFQLSAHSSTLLWLDCYFAGVLAMILWLFSLQRARLLDKNNGMICPPFADCSHPISGEMRALLSQSSTKQVSCLFIQSLKLRWISAWWKKKCREEKKRMKGNFFPKQLRCIKQRDRTPAHQWKDHLQ